MLNYTISAAAGLANANLPQFVQNGVTGTPAVGSMTTVCNGTGNAVQTLTFGGTSGESINALNLASGAGAGADVDPGTLSLNPTGALSVFAHAGADTAATLAGSIDFAATGRNLAVADGGAATDLLVTASLAGQTGATLGLVGTGTTEYAGAARMLNAGNTTVNEGTLVLNKTAGPAILARRSRSATRSAGRGPTWCGTGRRSATRSATLPGPGSTRPPWPSGRPASRPERQVRHAGQQRPGHQHEPRPDDGGRAAVRGRDPHRHPHPRRQPDRPPAERCPDLRGDASRPDQRQPEPGPDRHPDDRGQRRGRGRRPGHHRDHHRRGRRHPGPHGGVHRQHRLDRPGGQPGHHRHSNTSTVRSVTAGTGTNVLTAANLVRAGTARGTFLGVNTDLGTAANQVKFTGLANNLTLPCATVVGGSGTQATVLKGSLAEVTAPTDVVRLTRSEVINTAITVAGLEFAGDGMPP